MCIATSQCQLVATNSFVISGSITGSESEFSNCIGCEKQKQSQLKFSYSGLNYIQVASHVAIVQHILYSILIRSVASLL